MGEHAVLPDEERARWQQLARDVVTAIDQDEDTVAKFLGNEDPFALWLLSSNYTAELRRRVELMCIELVTLADERDAVAREFRGGRDA